MKRAFVLLCALLFLCACVRVDESTDVLATIPQTIPQTQDLPENRTVRVCVTQMLADSPVIEQLRAQFEEQSVYRLDYAFNSNSVAISVAQSGNADLLLVQLDTPTRQFVASGYGASCDAWLQTSLVLAGPADDPAGVRDAESAAAAMAQIAKTGSTFVSRYDDSDLCVTENSLWSQAGVVIGNGRKWYKPARREMVGTLRVADENDAYVLCEKETFLQNRDDLKLQILLDGTSDLSVRYCMIPVSPEAIETVNAEGAAAFVSFLQSAQTDAFLQSYGTESYGCPIYKTNLMEE